MNNFRSILLILSIVIFVSGCATWEGIKTDTSDGWNATKGAIHDATE